MLQRILNCPLFLFMTGAGALAMYVPAIVATAMQDWSQARVYMYSGTVFLTVAVMIAIATLNYQPRQIARSRLLTLLGTFLVLPLMLAFPLYEGADDVAFLDAYFEMVSSITTTGATVFDDPTSLTGADHIWRALVGWLGGFLIWVMAIAIMAPLNLGGFEVLRSAGNTQSSIALEPGQTAKGAEPSLVLRRFASSLAPIYCGLTLLMWVCLLSFGDSPIVAACHAMSVMATSGISPIGGTGAAESGLAGEAVIFLFLGFALSRRAFARENHDSQPFQLLRDPEFRLGVFCIVIVSVLLFMRHWGGALEVNENQSAGQAGAALWGTLFTVSSFLSTTGFVSSSWEAARGWSGLESPAMILLGLAVFGGGVATTAGGVKLLRIYVLYKNGKRELERLVHPSSVAGSGAEAVYLGREGVHAAWISFMLFAISIAAVMLVLSLIGLNFDESVILAIAALSTTGPLTSVAGDTPINIAMLPDMAKIVLCASMVLGRLEMLAIIALLNPRSWRR